MGRVMKFTRQTNYKGLSSQRNKNLESISLRSLFLCSISINNVQIGGGEARRGETDGFARDATRAEAAAAAAH